MIAMQLVSPAPVESGPLRAAELPDPAPGRDELLVRVRACGVCHTDLHVVEGELPLPKLPIVPGHQAVGVVEKLGEGAGGFKAGDRVGIAWLRWTCGQCRFCASGPISRADDRAAETLLEHGPTAGYVRENLCERAQFTGLDADGGYAELARVPADFAYPIPEGYRDHEAAPLLCAGVIGYRALRRSRVPSGGRLGLYGFGASAHIVIQIARRWKCEVYVFTRAPRHQELARELGAAWVGWAEDAPPKKLDAAISFAPAGALVPPALRALDKGGTLALAGIAMSPVSELDYRRDLYHERSLTSVANATRQDARELLSLAGEFRIETRTEQFPLADANRALQMMKESRLEASAVLMP